MTIISAPHTIHDLIERFERNLDAYKSGSYNETQVRREFIDPFFEALGWDVNNREGNAEAYKDVIHEDAVKVGRSTKAPDYSFRRQWFRYLRPGSYRYIRPTKLIFKGIDTRLSVGLLGENTLFNGANTPAFIPEDLEETSLNYLLGILNSRLMGFHLSGICPPKLGGYFRFNATNINNAPIRTIDFTNPTDKARHDRMVQLVEQMLALQKQLSEARTGHDRTLIERQIDATDRQIDKLVYELYGLTEEEIAVVEGKPS